MAAAPVQAPALHPRPAPGGRDGNPAYIVAVFVVFGCLLSLVGVAVRKGVCRGRSRGSGQVIHPPSGASFSFLGILFGTPSITPAAAVEVSPYRPSVDSSGGTPRRGLLIDSPCSPGLDQGLVKRLPMVCYKAAEHRRQGSGMRGAGAEDLRIESGRGMAEQGQQGSESCSVCLSCFLEGDFLRVLPECGHLFHLDCVDTWLLSRSTCPLCRCEVTGRNPSCSTKLGKLLARFGNGRSFGCSRSRSFSGMDLGSFRSRLGSEHDSFRSRLGTDQDAVITRSSRFIEIDLGELPAEGREAVVQIEDSVKATNARPGNVVEPAGITNLDMASVQPPAPAALRSIFVTFAEAGVGGEGATPQAVSHVQGSSQPISPGRLLVLEPARVPDQ